MTVSFDDFVDIPISRLRLRSEGPEVYEAL